MKPRVTLTSLPHEVLTSIGSYLDITSLIELSRVSPSFTALADDRVVWRHLPLYVPRHYGLSPSVELPSEYRDIASLNRLYAKSNSLSQQHGYALLAKVKDIIVRATPERWSMVREVTMRPRRGVLHPMLLVLDYVSSHIRRLIIDGATPHPIQPEGTFRTFELADFDCRSPFAYTTFSSLTHLHITSIASRYGDFYRDLVISSPCLETLEVDFDSDIHIPMDNAAEEAEDWRYEPHGPTRLRHIRFTWRLAVREKDLPAARIASGIIERSPEVQQVNINFGPEEPDPGVDYLFSAISEPRRLRDLRWPYTLWLLEKVPELRRLVLRRDKWYDSLEGLEPAEKLEILYLDTFTPVSDRQVTVSTDYPDPFPCPETYPFLAEILRVHPLLHTYHNLPTTTNMDDITLFDQLDHLESSGQIPPNITSMYHSEDERGNRDEVVQITFTRQFEQVAQGVPSEGLTMYLAPEHLTLPYEYKWEGELVSLGSEARKCNVFRRLLQPVKCVLTDYKGLAVPPEVVKEMREMEGGGHRNWEQRGIKVGAEAWAVLQKWYSESTAEAGNPS